MKTNKHVTPEIDSLFIDMHIDKSQSLNSPRELRDHHPGTHHERALLCLTFLGGAVLP